MTIWKGAALSAAMLSLADTAQAQELALGYFMSPNHPMNAAVFTPFAERLAEVSGGAMTVKQYAGGALNSSPPGQYSALQSGVMDIAFTLPGYTADLFPVTNAISSPGVCDGAVACTQALHNALPLLQEEFDAKILAIWANDPPVLVTRDVAVRTPADMAGLTLRVTTAADVPYVEAMGGSPVSQPANVLNQNLTNGVIDGIFIGPDGIRSFSLQEPANYVTIGMPLSGAAFVLLMNQGVYDGLSDQEKGWVDEAANLELSLQAGQAYADSTSESLDITREAGVEVIELTPAERSAFADAIVAPLDAFRTSIVRDDLTGADVLDVFANGTDGR